MRKAFAIMLALLIACTGGVIYAFADANAPREAVVYTEKVLYGDPSAAHGLNIDLRVHYKYHLLWQSHLDFDQNRFHASTNYMFSQDESRENPPHDHKGVFLQDGLRLSMEISKEGEPTGIRKALDELLSETEPGTTKKQTIRLADYYVYYPIMVHIELPGLLYTHYPPADSSRIDIYSSRENYAVKTMQDFFRIPVLDNHYMDIEASKVSGGNSAQTSGIGRSERGDSFSMNTAGVTGEYACYFWFSNRTRNDNLVDTSLIPGGYGIYKLPYGYVDYMKHVAESGETYEYTGPDVFVDELSVFYPVDVETRILHLGVNQKKTRLLLHTAEDDKYIVTIIDIKNGEALQRLVVSDYDYSEDWYEVDDGDGFTFIRLGNKRICVVSEGPGENYEISINSELAGVELEDDYLPWNWYNRCMAFDGERLAISGSSFLTFIDDKNMRGSNCGFFVAIYTADGLQYYGIYESSLDRANYHTANIRLTYNIRPVDYDPVRVSWDK